MRNRKFRFVLLVQLAVLAIVAGIMMLYKEHVITIPASDFRVENDQLVSSSFSLPRGIYRVLIPYVCEGNMQTFCTVTENEDSLREGGRGIRTSGQHMNEGGSHTDFTLWVDHGKASQRITLTGALDSMQIADVSIRSTRQIYARDFLLLAVLFILMDSLWLCADRWREYPLCMEKKTILAGLLFIIVVSSIPLLNSQIYAGSDVTYHLLRIDNIKDGILSGQFPVRIDPTWLWGHGYASSVCYGETFLYIPAFLRICGFTLQESYFTFLFLLNVATCLCSFYSFRKLFARDRVALLCAGIYTLSIYRLYKMYSWNALGEVQAMVFLPLILAGAYEILAGESSEEGYHRRWVLLAIGFGGLIQCHLLSCEMGVFFLAVVCIVQWRRFLRPAAVWNFVKAVLGSFALSAWFAVPCLDYLLNVDMVIGHVSARTIQEVGLYPANLFVFFFNRGFNRDFESLGMQDMEALGIGAVFSVAGLALLLLWFFGALGGQKPDLERKTDQLGKTALFGGILAMIMSLSVFPWNRLQQLGSVAATLISSIQYPNRFLMIATIFMTVVAGVVVIRVDTVVPHGGKQICAIAFAVMVLLSAHFYMSSIVLTDSAFEMYDTSGMGTGYLSGGEYLRYGAQTSLYGYTEPVGSEEVVVEEVSRNHLTYRILLKNTGKADGYVDIPLQNYKGYVARDEASGMRFAIEDNDNMDIRVRVPEGYRGEVIVEFLPPVYWRFVEILSLVSYVTLLLVFLFAKRSGGLARSRE